MKPRRILLLLVLVADLLILLALWQAQGVDDWAAVAKTALAVAQGTP